MNAIDIEKLNQLISRTDISGNDKVRWLTDFIDGRELQLEQGRSYSEEEVYKSFDNLRFKKITIEELNSLPYQPFITDEDGNIWIIDKIEWFEQFKKNKIIKQSAVEWLISQLFGAKRINIEEAIEQAKEMEKQQQGYSEEEVMDMFHNLSTHLPLHYEFLVKEQFKKK